VSSSLADIEGSSPVLEALGFLVATSPAFLEHSSSIPLEVSALRLPWISLLQKSIDAEVAILSSTAATLFPCTSDGFASPAIKSGS
jgi:hypothetical protein